MSKKEEQSLTDLFRFSNPYSGLTKKETKAADRYGISLNSYGFNHPDGRNRASPKKDPRNFQSDIAAAANADYDTRRSIEAAALSGNKKAEKYARDGFTNLEDVTKANNIFTRMHARNGNGGEFNSQSDYSGLTYDLVKKDREQVNARDFKNNYISERFGSRDNSNTELEIPSRTSGDASAGDNSIASSINKTNEIDITGTRNAADQDNSNDQKQAGGFLDKYKLSLNSDKGLDLTR
jgi:hypothetical protein